MTHEPLVAPAELPPDTRAEAPGLEQPAPPAERQQIADDLFGQAASGLLGLQMGVMAAGLIADNVSEKPLPKELPPRLRPPAAE